MARKTIYIASLFGFPGNSVPAGGFASVAQIAQANFRLEANQKLVVTYAMAEFFPDDAGGNGNLNISGAEIFVALSNAPGQTIYFPLAVQRSNVPIIGANGLWLLAKGKPVFEFEQQHTIVNLAFGNIVSFNFQCSADLQNIDPTLPHIMDTSLQVIFEIQEGPIGG